jgi:hypothetical protein
MISDGNIFDMSLMGHARHFDGLPMTSGLPPGSGHCHGRSACLKVPKGDEWKSRQLRVLTLRAEAAGRRYQKCRNDGKRYCDG